MSKSFFSTDPNTHQSENTWFTPKRIIDSLGPFDLDPCTVSYRPFDTAERNIQHDKGGNGLEIEWRGRVWMNPPYGKELKPFYEKFKGHNFGIALIFARMGNECMQDWLKHGGGVFFLRKRIKFIDKAGKSDTNAGTDSCLLFLSYHDQVKIQNSGIEGVFINTLGEYERY